MIKKQKVLVVDDNRVNIKFIADVLSQLNYVSLVFATNGYKAIEIVENQEIDIILMDINMPGIDGFETVERMNTNIPIIYVTALNDSENVLKAFDNGGVDYITKPFVPEELKVRVSTHLRLTKLNKNLAEEVEVQIQKNKEKEKILIHQSKLASMGEMIDAIAHQWKQPLSLINLRMSLLSQTFDDGKLDESYMQKFKEKISINLEHMNTTINEFRTFFRPNDKTEEFDMKSMIQKVLILIEDEVLNNKIDIQINDIENFKIIGVENEFKHLLLNLINNAKDSFNENNIPFNDRKIDINIYVNNNKEILEVIDNAGGVQKDIIDNIFKANVSTKEDGQGSGVGLYLSSQIAQKYNGVLKVENSSNGAKFIYEQFKEI